MPVQATLTQVNTLAAHSVLSVWSSASDFLVVLVLFGALFLVAWYVGKGTFFSLLIALYPAYALYAVFPYASALPASPPLVAQLGTYLAFTLVGYVVLRRVVTSDFIYIGLFGLITLSFLGAGFLLALAYHTFPVATVYHFTPAVDALFAPKQFFFWWFIAPLVGLLAFAR